MAVYGKLPSPAKSHRYEIATGWQINPDVTSQANGSKWGLSGWRSFCFQPVFDKPQFPRHFLPLTTVFNTYGLAFLRSLQRDLSSDGWYFIIETSEDFLGWPTTEAKLEIDFARIGAILISLFMLDAI